MKTMRGTTGSTMQDSMSPSRQKSFRATTVKRLKILRSEIGLLCFPGCSSTCNPVRQLNRQCAGSVALPHLLSGDGKKKKAGKAEKSEAAPKKTAVDEAAFAELTACTDELLADGEFDVYSYSYEKVAYEIKELESAPVAAVEDNTGPKFEYKWSEDALETYGPYTAKQMLSWQEQAFFKDGAVCREIKEGSETRWYSAKRVDFDLYID
eukprot:m.36413 g.36413  ORF g.36413 m.36413 type:complete len:209 (+) comp7571_c0_seq1:656-1282(+)